MSKAAEALQRAIDLLSRFYESPDLTHSRALVLIDEELPRLREALREELNKNQPPQPLSVRGSDPSKQPRREDMTTYEFQKVTLNGRQGWIVTRRIAGVYSGRAFGVTKKAGIEAFAQGGDE